MLCYHQCMPSSWVHAGCLLYPLLSHPYSRREETESRKSMKHMPTFLEVPCCDWWQYFFDPDWLQYMLGNSFYLTMLSLPMDLGFSQEQKKLDMGQTNRIACHQIGPVVRTMKLKVIKSYFCFLIGRISRLPSFKMKGIYLYIFLVLGEWIPLKNYLHVPVTLLTFSSNKR